MRAAGAEGPDPEAWAPDLADTLADLGRRRIVADLDYAGAEQNAPGDTPVTLGGAAGRRQRWTAGTSAASSAVIVVKIGIVEFDLADFEGGFVEIVVIEGVAGKAVKPLRRTPVGSTRRSNRPGWRWRGCLGRRRKAITARSWSNSSPATSDRHHRNGGIGTGRLRRWSPRRRSEGRRIIEPAACRIGGIMPRRPRSRVSRCRRRRGQRGYHIAPITELSHKVVLETGGAFVAEHCSGKPRQCRVKPSPRLAPELC